IIGGSQREERLDVLRERMETMGLDTEEYGWYLDLRRYGTVPHAGFGLGLERAILYATGMANIRDVIPYPRTPGHAEYGRRRDRPPTRAGARNRHRNGHMPLPSRSEALALMHEYVDSESLRRHMY